MALARIFTLGVLICLLNGYGNAATPPRVIGQDQVPTSVYEQALDSLGRGESAEAEKLLRPALREHPRDARALGLMGVILDAQQRYDDAERYYKLALDVNPDSVSLLNNLGNHYLARGEMVRAQAAFARVVTLQPGHPNANLQLARISVAEKHGGQALAHLRRLSPQDQAVPAARLLRAQALDLQGKRAEAVNVLAELARQTPHDAAVAFSIGMLYVSWKRYEDAEGAFGQALQAQPTNFDVLYNLALAAMQAGHLDRAQEVFAVALQQRPEDVDTLYHLASLRSEQGHDEQAMALLVQAQHLAPRRSDILLLMAQTAEKLGYYRDSAEVLDQYLKLQPADEVARRERAFALVCIGRQDEALPDLRRYVQMRPKDARGLYELGMVETIRDRDQALQHFSQALEIDPHFDDARSARAVLNFQAGKFLQAVEDLELVRKRKPENFSALDTLGECYLKLGRNQEALDTLSHAAQLAPNNPEALMRYSRALLSVGRKEEARTVLHQFEQLGPDARSRPQRGLLDFFNLSPPQRRAQYLANIEAQIRAYPHDLSLRVLMGKELLAQGKTAEALQAFRGVLPLTSEANILAECGKALLAGEQYDAAHEFLERAVAVDLSAGDARLDLAIAAFHMSGPEVGLAELEKVPAMQRRGDYFLLRAQMLDAQGKPEEARESLNQGIRAAPTRRDLYFQAALFLIKHQHYQPAVDLLQQALRAIPDEPKLLLTEAIAYGLMDWPVESRKVLNEIESRWPEWSQPYLIDGVILSGHAKFAEAKPLLETALALGSNDATAYYNLALADSHITPPDEEGARHAIEVALRLSPADAYIQSLAGEIAYEQKDYQAALEHLNAAVRIQPDLAEVHEWLGSTYRALGETEKTTSEMKEVARIKQQANAPDQTTLSSPASLLFLVRAPQP
jgi:tetratricopeptide (TPR) repeat protein